MSDKDKSAKAAPTENKADNKADNKAGDKKGTVVKAKEVIKRVEKAPWTLERVMSHARRYADEATWAGAHPSSYKSATAHGWLAQCLQAQTAGGKVVNFPAKKEKSAAKHNDRKAA